VFGPFLALFGSLLAGPVPAISIPIWDQYVDLIEWSLDSLARALQSGGLAIVVFTILIKTVLMPLTVRSLQSSKAMQELQPKIKELQKKHGKDRQRLTQETMALYSANRVNPMSGCLPMLLQIPIFLGLYNGILHLSRGQTDYWNENFLWLWNGLEKPDPIFILPVLAGLFQFVQTRMMRPANQGKITDPQQAMMNTMMNIMPLTVVFFGWNFASGAVLYWATQSIYSVIQQWFITGWGSLRDWVPGLPELPEHRRLGYRAPRPIEDVVVVSGEGAPARPAGAMGWLQKRMEAAQQQAETRRGGSGTQARADAETETIVETTGTTAASRATSNRNSARRGKGRGSKQRGGSASGAKAVPEPAPTNGQPARAMGNSRAVVVPRKARPATGADGKSAS